MSDEDEDAGFPNPVDPEDEDEFAKNPEKPPATEEEQMDEAVIASLLEELGRLKEAGNAHFKKGENTEAVALYRRAADLLEAYQGKDNRWSVAWRAKARELTEA